MANKVKLGIIGAGGMATHIHVPSISEIEEAEIVAICDLYEDKAKSLAEKYGVKKTYALHHEMLEKEELDAVVVLVNPERAYWVANDCLRAGKHILMEKPAGISAYQAHSLERTAKEVGKIAAVAMNRRHIPLIREVIKKVKAVTEITEVDSRFMKFCEIDKAWHYTSAYISDIIHAIDILRYAAGSEPKDVATLINSYNSPVDNAWTSIIRFENGVTGTLRANYQTGTRIHDLELHGPKACAHINLGFGDMNANATIFYNNSGSLYSAASGGGMGEPEMEVLDAVEVAGRSEYSHYYGYKAENVDFIEAILNNREPICTIADAAKSMDMAELILEKKI